MLQREINNLIDKIIVYPAGNPNDTTPDSVRFAGKKQKQGHKNWNYQKRYMDIYFKTGTIRSLVQMYEERWIAIDTKMSREDREGYEMILKEQNN